MPRVMEPPPFTPVEPVTEVLHGVEITDPYRWLEDQQALQTREWLKEQARYMRAYLDAIPDRERIRNRVEELLAVEMISDPWKVGNRYFYSKRPGHGEQALIVMREGEMGNEHLLFDPGEKDPSHTSAAQILSVSQRGDLIAFRNFYGGDARHSIGFIDVASKTVLRDELPSGVGFGLVFSPNGDGFYYSHEMAETHRPCYRAVCWHSLGSTLDRDREIFFAGDEAHVHVELFGSDDACFLAYRVIYARDPQVNAIYVQDMVSGTPARKILEYTGTIFFACFSGSRLVALTDWSAPNLRVVAFDLNDLEGGCWIEVVPESAHRLNDFSIAANLVCVTSTQDISNKIDVFDLSGRRHNSPSYPPHCTISLSRHDISTDTLFYEVSSFNQAPTIRSWNPRTEEETIWANAQFPCDLASIQMDQPRYRSRDGTEIPISLFTKKGLDLAQPLPTFITGYGGYGSSRTPHFNIYSTFLIENGFLFAVPTLRGGGEFGADWYHAAKRQKRQNAIDDFISAAEWLIHNGYSTPERVAIGGVSNGGLLVGAALTQRPELFRAVLCVAPLLDMLRYHLFDDANYGLDEFGHSGKEDDFRHLLAYSPYHQTRIGVSYPSVLIVSGDLDRCCNPMHARKMTARLQAATKSGRPVLLDYKETRGHVPVQPLSRRIDALTDRLAFVCHELGARV
jgi:prolyl oligopeptidase